MIVILVPLISYAQSIDYIYGLPSRCKMQNLIEICQKWPKNVWPHTYSITQIFGLLSYCDSQNFAQKR